MRLREIARILHMGKTVGRGETPVSGFSIDSRTLVAGDLFFALPGARADGHDFIQDVFRRGAAGAVATHVPLAAEQAGLLDHHGLILVPDVLRALQELALAYRLQAAVPVVAVTGSNGKTTTKDLIAAVLNVRYQTLKTAGNFNNELGLPLTLLRLAAGAQAAVVEMGMRGLGQIKELCAIARPDYGVITNIGTAHFELLGSRENIVQAKGELLDNLPEQGAAILNYDDPGCRRLGKQLGVNRSSLRVIYYGLQEGADYRAREITDVGDGIGFVAAAPGEKETRVFLPLPGHHNVQNALAALAVGGLLEISLAQGAVALAKASVSTGRLTRVAGLGGATLIDDTYNANPVSMTASLQVLAAAAGQRRIAVLGSMGELGALKQAGHREVGAKAAGLPLDLLITVGAAARWIAEEAAAQGMEREKIRICEHNRAVIDCLAPQLASGDLVLIKGSRAAAMEEIVAALTGPVGGRGE